MKNRCAIAATNTSPPSLGLQGDAVVVFIIRNSWCLEDYTEEFLDTCHLTSCLMEGFCYRLDDDICFIMPWGDPCWTLKSYIDFALWMKGSAFTVGKADVEDFISIQPYHADFSQHLPRAQPAIIPTQHRSEVGYTDHTWGNISGVRRHGGKPRPHSYHWGWVVTGLWRSVGTITSSLPSSSVWSSYLLAPSSPCLQSSLFPSSLKSLCWFRPALNLLFLRWFHMALNLLCFLCVPPALTLLYPSNSHPSSLSHLCCLVLLV